MKSILVMLFSFIVFSFQANAATYLYLYSQTGDYLGQGEETIWMGHEGSFSASRNHDNGISLSFAGATEQWYLDFAASNKDPLIFGSYLDAAHNPAHSLPQHRLNVYASNRYCNEANGRFDVLETAYDINGDVVRFSAYFEVHCEDADSALFGAVRYNSSNKLRIKPPSTEDNLCSYAPTSAECANQGIQALLEHDKEKVALLQKNASRLLSFSSSTHHYSSAVDIGDNNPISPLALTNLHAPKMKKIGKEKITDEDNYKPMSVCIIIPMNGYLIKACDPPFDFSGL